MKRRFSALNKRYFDGELECTVRFGPCNSTNFDAQYDPNVDEIVIAESLSGNHAYIEFLLLHEMIHAKLEDEEPCARSDHGAMFQDEKDRLYFAGALDGIW